MYVLRLYLLAWSLLPISGTREGGKEFYSSYNAPKSDGLICVCVCVCVCVEKKLGIENKEQTN